MKKIPIRSNDEDSSDEPNEQLARDAEEKVSRKIEVHEPGNNTKEATENTPNEKVNDAQTSSLEIKINFPSFKGSINKLKSIPKKKLLSLFALIMILGGSYFFLQKYTFLPWQNDTNQETSALQNLAQNPENLPRGNPTLEALTPNGQTLDEDTWVRISPEGNDPVYAYTDMIGDVQIAVSQQPLPENLRGDVAKNLNELAIDFGAAEKISVEGETVYIGTSGNGPQSVLLTKSDLLILIKSTERVSTDNWVRYIRALQ